MRKILPIFLLLQCAFTLSVHAQFARLEKYPNIPGQYDAAFVDYVKNFASGVVQTTITSFTTLRRVIHFIS